MTERILIVGAGSWGLAMSGQLSRCGHHVSLWEPLPTSRDQLRQRREDPDRLPGLHLDNSIQLLDQVSEADSPTLIALVVPSQYVRSTLQSIRDELDLSIPVVNLAKGIETGSLETMSQVITAELPISPEQVAVLSGPSHAEEVLHDLPTTVVAASTSERLTLRVQETFSGGHFRVYVSDDVLGVELGGSLKNPIAIAAGIADALKLGDNTKGALMTRGLAEISRLGVAMGARPETFSGLSGIGDLITTCVSRHSRNRLVGERIGRLERLDDIRADMKMVAEGVDTTRAVMDLGRKYKIEMPITEAVHKTLFDGVNPTEALDELMGRKLRPEIWQ